MNWRKQAACDGMDVSVFHPRSATGPQVDKPKAVCNSCPVRAECLKWATDIEDREGQRMDGIWGGLTASERAGLNQRDACQQGHPMVTEDQFTYWPNGSKRCRQCKRDADNRAARKKKEAA